MYFVFSTELQNQQMKLFVQSSEKFWLLCKMYLCFHRKCISRRNAGAQMIFFFQHINHKNASLIQF